MLSNTSNVKCANKFHMRCHFQFAKTYGLCKILINQAAFVGGVPTLACRRKLFYTISLSYTTIHFANTFDGQLNFKFRLHQCLTQLNVEWKLENLLLQNEIYSLSRKPFIYFDCSVCTSSIPIDFRMELFICCFAQITSKYTHKYSNETTRTHTQVLCLCKQFTDYWTRNKQIASK